MYPYKRSHASGLGLVAPSPGDLTPDLIVQLQDVVNGWSVLDLTAGDVILARAKVVRAFGTQTLKKYISGEIFFSVDSRRHIIK